MDRELLYEEIYGRSFDCDGCVCKSCDHLESSKFVCVGNCYYGPPDCKKYSCDSYSLKSEKEQP